jgi:hypothetical protein
MNRILEQSSNTTSYSADPGEPDTGWVPGGEVRMLGFESGKPESWFHQLEFEQVEFPVADHIYGKGVKAVYSVTKNVQVVDLKKMMKSIDADIEEIKNNTSVMLGDLKKRK